VNRLDFTLVTTCRNEIRSFDRWKQNVIEQTRPPSEIVIVDAFSDDGTAEKLFEWASSDKRVKVIQEKGAAAHGRNLAIKNAKHEIILSTDMGVRLSDNWCEELIKPFEADPTVEVVAGNTCIDKDTVKTVAARAEYYYENGGESKLGPGFVPGNRSVAYTKKVWSKLGGLPEDLTFYADDSVFGRQMVQANLNISYAPLAMTYWARPQKLKQFFREQYVYGRGGGEAFIKTPIAFKLYLERKVPLSSVPIIQAFTPFLKTKLYVGMIRAIRNADIKVMFTMPVLIAGKAYHNAKGYAFGYSVGTVKCTQCRNRLKRDCIGFSLF
jgi:cellulose synthase/poly-beta-1,6-N-acetylglucosamine synthase-like glycosyltransferase